MSQSSVNIYMYTSHLKYPNDEIVFMLDLWCQVQKDTAMKCHMKTVKHQLEAKKYTITDESTDKTEVQVILIAVDLLN